MHQVGANGNMQRAVTKHEKGAKMATSIETELILRASDGEEVVVRRLVASSTEMKGWMSTASDDPDRREGSLVKDVGEAFLTLAAFCERKPRIQPKAFKPGKRVGGSRRRWQLQGRVCA